MDRRRSRTLLILAAILVVAASVGVAATRHRRTAREAAQAAHTPPPAPVVTAAARVRDMSVYLGGVGTVTSLRTVAVKSRVDGELTAVLFKEGQVVEPGQLLAQIDPRPYRVQLEQAQGQMARDQAVLNNAQVDLQRYQTLVAQGLIARQQADTQVALVRQYEGVIKTDQGQIDNAKLMLTYCRITAPIGGRIGLRQVDPGNMVHASDANGIVVITQLQPIAVLFTLPEDSLPPVMQRLARGERLPVEAYDREGKRKLAAGSLLTVDNQIDPATGTVRLKAEFPNADYSLFPNQFVNARMLIDVRRSAVVVPAAAVQRSPQGSFVYVVKPDQTATVRPVTVGVTEGEDVAIDKGVAAGEAVVVDGAERLREGAKVQQVRSAA